MTRAGKEMDGPFLRPCLHMTRAIHKASWVKNTSQKGLVIELTGWFPSQGRQPWAMAGGRAAGPLVCLFSLHLKQNWQQNLCTTACRICYLSSSYSKSQHSNYWINSSLSNSGLFAVTTADSVKYYQMPPAWCWGQSTKICMFCELKFSRFRAL